MVIADEYKDWQENIEELDDMTLTGRELIDILDVLILERDINANFVD